MVPEDVVLAGFRDRVARAAEEDPSLEVYLCRQQAHRELRKAIKEHVERQLSSEDLRRIKLAFYRGIDLVYSNEK